MSQKDTPQSKPEQSKWQMALRPGGDWEKEDFLEVVYWIRQLLAFVCGVGWGLVPLTGLMGLVSFAVVSWFVLYMFSKYQEVDEESCGTWELLSEGFGSAYATFLATWTIVFTLTHGDL